MTYIPRSETAKEIHQIYGELSTAQHQWNTYAALLGSGYTMAYQNHKKVLDDMAEKRRASSETMYFVLSLLCVGFGGGIVGGLMAPWVAKAGEQAAEQMVRTALSETAQSFAGNAIQKGLEYTKSDPNRLNDGKSLHDNYKLYKGWWRGYQYSGSPYSVITKDPLLYYQDMLGEIGKCFSILRDEVEKLERKADAENLPGTFAVDTRYRFAAIPIVGDHPKTNDLPDKTEIARHAELGMWIAWANARDKDYWNTRINALSDGLSFFDTNELIYNRDLYQLNPVVTRLKSLGVELYVKMIIPSSFLNPKGGTVLNMNRLAYLGYHLGDPFYVRLSDVASCSDVARRVLSSTAALPPKYKR